MGKKSTKKLSKKSTKATVKQSRKRKREETAKKSTKRQKISSRSSLIQRVGQNLITTETCEPLEERETEYNTVKNFLEQNLKKRKGGCLYIAGSPGTGKSATLHNLKELELKKWKKQKKMPKYHVISFKGMGCKSVIDVYDVLLNGITDAQNLERMKTKDHHDAVEKLTKLLTASKKKKKTMFVVIIDEVDALLSDCKGEKFSQRVLYHLFSLPSKPNSSLILIGLANSIDLSQRFLPLLERKNIGPQTLIFEPYTSKQLIDIMNKKLGEEGKELFDVIALRLCAKKVSSMKGDCRQCLLLCREALQQLEESESVKVGFIEMKGVLKSLENPMAGRIKRLVYEQQKILVIAAILFKKQQKNTRTNLWKFHKHISDQLRLPGGLSDTDFTAAIDALISQSYFDMVKKNKANIRFQVLKFCVQFVDVQEAVEDVAVLKKLISSKMEAKGSFLKLKEGRN